MEPALSDKLAGVGLIPRSNRETAKLGDFLADYCKRRIDVKPATQIVWQQVARDLKAHIGENREMTCISETDAEDFKMYLIQKKLAPTTISKRLQFARMFFHGACKRKLILTNPFLEVSHNGVIFDERKAFISREDTAKLLSVCDPTWKVIVALARFGGLRCPSEVLSLRWIDIKWETERIIVQSPKTEHHAGKASRELPLFPELFPILMEASELAPDGAEFVVGGNYRQAAMTDKGWANCNLRTHLERLLKRAGLKSWPRLFHSMRATRETELAAQFAIHVVAAWLGNTPKIALKHYLTVTDDDFQRAIRGGAISGAFQVQLPVQPEYAATRSGSLKMIQAP